MDIGGKIIIFLREYVFILSIIFTILGGILLFLGVTMIWFQDIPENMFGLSENAMNWNVYVLIFGFVVFAWFGFYYLYSFITTRKFVLEELETNKRSEFLKKHSKVKVKVKHLPSKYAKMLKDKEKELKIK